jgi:hypothetical protein
VNVTGESTHIIWSGRARGVTINGTLHTETIDGRFAVSETALHRLGPDDSLHVSYAGRLDNITIHNLDYELPDLPRSPLEYRADRVTSIITVIRLRDGQPHEITMTQIANTDDRIEIR